MTSKTEEYQVKAREYEQQAKEATHGLQKQVYAEFARQWREMAEQVETPRLLLGAKMTFPVGQSMALRNENPAGVAGGV